MEPNQPAPGIGILPTELILEFSTHVTSLRDIASLTRVSKSFHCVFNPILYQRNATGRDGSAAVMWGAEHNLVSTIEYARLAGADIAKAFHQPNPHHGALTEPHPPARPRRRERSFLDDGSSSGPDCGPHGYWWHAVDVAARYNSADVLRYLVEQGVYLGGTGSRGLCGDRKNCLVKRKVLFLRNMIYEGQSASGRMDEWPMHDPVQMARCWGHEEMADLVTKLRMEEVDREEAQIELGKREKDERERLRKLLQAVEDPVFSYRDFVLEVSTGP